MQELPNGYYWEKRVLKDGSSEYTIFRVHDGYVFSEGYNVEIPLNKFLSCVHSFQGPLAMPPW